MTAQDDALAQLNPLLDEYATLRSQTTGMMGATPQNLALIQRLLAAIDRLSLPNSTYARSAEPTRNSRANTAIRLGELIAVATALRDDIQAGWISTVLELAHADTYSDYLEQAEGLLSQAYKDAAAVIAGTSLEVQLKALAAKHGIDVQMPNGSAKKANTLTADLKSVGVYGTLEHQQVLAWLALRNAAAHGNYGEYDDTGVKALIEGVRNFAVRYPA